MQHYTGNYVNNDNFSRWYLSASVHFAFPFQSAQNPNKHRVSLRPWLNLQHSLATQFTLVRFVRVVTVRVVPYASIDERREKQRERYRQKYWTDEQFRQREAERKAEWFQAPGVREWRAEAKRYWRKMTTGGKRSAA